MRTLASAATARRGAPVALCDLALRAPRLTRRATAVAPLDHYQRRAGRPLPVVVLE